MSPQITHLNQTEAELIRSPVINLVSESKELEICSDIFRYDCEMVVWRRELSANLQTAIAELINSGLVLYIHKCVSLQSVAKELDEPLAKYKHIAELVIDVTGLVKTFCDLFDQQQAKLHLDIISDTTCPRFHADNVPCRLICTYAGSATQWLPDQAVDRSKLGNGNKGLPDELSGLYHNADDIQQLTTGEVALMKGKLWPGHEHAGLVHRSPSLKPGEKRLLLTLDFA